MYFAFGELYGWTAAEIGQMTVAQTRMYGRDIHGKHERPGVMVFRGRNAQRRALQIAARRG